MAFQVELDVPYRMEKPLPTWASTWGLPPLPRSLMAASHPLPNADRTHAGQAPSHAAPTCGPGVVSRTTGRSTTPDRPGLDIPIANRRHDSLQEAETRDQQKPRGHRHRRTCRYVISRGRPVVPASLGHNVAADSGSNKAILIKAASPSVHLLDKQTALRGPEVIRARGTTLPGFEPSGLHLNNSPLRTSLVPPAVACAGDAYRLGIVAVTDITPALWGTGRVKTPPCP